MDKNKGQFIVFEGLDGAGTSTQIVKLKNWLNQQKIFAEITKEPTNGPFGAVIRQAIEQRIKVDAKSIALAFASDRIDHIKNPHNGIEKSLNQGFWVLCDRYILSNIAYQGSAGIDIDWLFEINRFAIQPDLTIFIDTLTQVCIERMNKRSTHSELFHQKQKLDKIKHMYTTLLHPDKLKSKSIIIDGNRDEDEVFADVIVNIKNIL